MADEQTAELNGGGGPSGERCGDCYYYQSISGTCKLGPGSLSSAAARSVALSTILSLGLPVIEKTLLDHAVGVAESPDPWLCPVKVENDWCGQFRPKSDPKSAVSS